MRNIILFQMPVSCPRAASCAINNATANNAGAANNALRRATSTNDSPNRPRHSRASHTTATTHQNK